MYDMLCKQCKRKKKNTMEPLAYRYCIATPKQYFFCCRDIPALAVSHLQRIEDQSINSTKSIAYNENCTSTHTRHIEHCTHSPSLHFLHLSIFFTIAHIPPANSLNSLFYTLPVPTLHVNHPIRILLIFAHSWKPSCLSISLFPDLQGSTRIYILHRQRNISVRLTFLSAMGLLIYNTFSSCHPSDKLH